MFFLGLNKKTPFQRKIFRGQKMTFGEEKNWVKMCDFGATRVIFEGNIAKNIDFFGGAPRLTIMELIFYGSNEESDVRFGRDFPTQPQGCPTSC